MIAEVDCAAQSEVAVAHSRGREWLLQETRTTIGMAASTNRITHGEGNEPASDLSMVIDNRVFDDIPS